MYRLLNSIHQREHYRPGVGGGRGGGGVGTVAFKGPRMESFFSPS